MPATGVGGTGVRVSANSSPTVSLWARVFMDGRRGLHVETVQSALTVIPNRSPVAWSASSWLLWEHVIFSSKVSSFPFPAASPKKCGSLCHDCSLVIMQLTFPPSGVSVSIKELKGHRILSVVPEEELKVLEEDFQSLMTKLLLFWPIYLSLLLLLHVFTSLIKLIL